MLSATRRRRIDWRLVELEEGEDMASNAKGVATAIVTDNKDPDALCRVKVRYPWHDEPKASHWARLATPMAGKGRGVVLIPEVGDEVLVAFEREDLRFPYVIGGLWNGNDPPPVSNTDSRNDKRLIRSRKGHRLLFDDGATGAVELAMDNGRRVVMDDRGVCVQDEKGNQFRIDSRTGAVEITSTGKLTIRASAVSIEAAGPIDIKAGATLTLRGALINLN
jgi:uncharacterized protein involved in type VI secretion and phage assembly